MKKIRIGISACLLGENVRYDGGHALDHFLSDTLGKYVEYVPVCPEVECGLGVPRETVRLTGDPERPRLVTTRTGIDHTERMEAWAGKRAAELEKEELCGFIFKSKSPSSGMERVKVYDDKGMSRKVGVGIFARIFMEHFPLIPVEEDGRLHDPVLRENFIDRIFTVMLYRQTAKQKKIIRSLIEFHSRNKLMLMAHSPKCLKEMGVLVAHAEKSSPNEIYGKYEKLLMEAMATKSTKARHANVLHHAMGYFRKNLSPDEKQEMLEVVENYRKGLTPLVVPLTLINHYVRKYDQPYLKEQTYLNPHPVELLLRNHV